MELTLEEKAKSIAIRLIIEELPPDIDTAHEAYDVIMEFAEETISELEGVTGLTIAHLLKKQTNDINAIRALLEVLHDEVVQDFKQTERKETNE
jgi:hypothetical protein